MLQNWLILLPEISLLSFFPLAFLANKYRINKTAKTFFTLSKFSLIFTIIFTIVFYNKSVWPQIWLNSQYSTLFKLLIYVIALPWFYLSSKWFLNKNRTSMGFYTISMEIIFLLTILLSAQTFIIPMIVVPVLCFLTQKLMLQHLDEDKEKHPSILYTKFSIIFCLLLWGGALILWYNANSLSYVDIAAYLSQQDSRPISVYFAAILILSSLLYMMAAAPFHLWFVEVINISILPVCGFLTLIPPFAYLSCLIIIMSQTFVVFNDILQITLQGFAIFSLALGAFSANQQTNLRRLFAFCTIYNLGFMLLGVLSFKNDANMSAFVYTLIYVMAMFGVYTVFLSLKSKGDYLSSIDDICGLSETKPYISAAFLIFMISLIGIPPFLGFWGRLSLINILVIEGRWWHFGILMLALLFMANSFLHIIGKIYFGCLHTCFDRTDKAIYICLFINLLLVLITILNPTYLLHNTEIIFQGAR